MTREDCYGEMVRPKVGEGEPRYVGKKMAAQKGGFWRGGLALGGNASREVFVRNSKLWTVDHPIEGLPSGHFPIISCFEEPGGIVSV